MKRKQSRGRIEKGCDDEKVLDYDDGDNNKEELDNDDGGDDGVVLDYGDECIDEGASGYEDEEGEGIDEVEGEGEGVAVAMAMAMTGDTEEAAIDLAESDDEVRYIEVLGTTVLER